MKTLKSKIAVGLALAMTAGVASAALPADAQGAIDSIALFVDDILVAVWGIVTVVTVGFVGIKLFKKGASKAT